MSTCPYQLPHIQAGILMTWLKENCTIFPEDAPSGEFTGIAIDYHGKEDQEPTFDVNGTFQLIMK